MSLCILTPNDWDNLYSRDDYKKVMQKDPAVPKDVSTKVRNGIVEYFIALGQSDDVIMSQIAKKPAFLRQTHNRHGLNCLQLAIMKGRESLVPKLLAAGASLDEPDAYGWLPIHHAAIGGDRLFHIILQHGGDSKKPTRLGGTCEDLRQLVGLEELTTSLSGLHIEDEPGKQVPFTPEPHLQIFGMTKYTDSPYYTQEHIKKLWIQRAEVIEEVFHFEANNRAVFEMAVQNPPRVALRLSTSGGNTGSNWGIFADEDLQFGRGLFSYSGQYAEYERHGTLPDILAGRVTPRPYLLDSFDGKSVGNCGRFLNEGFPNCMVFHTRNYKGLARRYALMVIQKDGVRKGEELLYDYGQGAFQLKWNTLYKISNPESMREFVKSHTMEDIENFISKTNQAIHKANTITPELALDQQRATAYRTQMIYCFTTPAAIVDLWCNNCITAKNWLEQMEGSRLYNRLIPEDHKAMTNFTTRFMELLIDFEEDLEKNESLKSPIKAFISNLQGRLTYLEIVEVIRAIHIWLIRENRGEWEQHSEWLLKAYPHTEGRDIQ